jgi:hypothetical protein
MRDHAVTAELDAMHPATRTANCDGTVDDLITDSMLVGICETVDEDDGWQSRFADSRPPPRLRLRNLSIRRLSNLCHSSDEIAAEPLVFLIRATCPSITRSSREGAPTGMNPVLVASLPGAGQDPRLDRHAKAKKGLCSAFLLSMYPWENQGFISRSC